MKQFKRFMAVVLIGMMIVTIAACGKKDEDTSNTTTVANTTVEKTDPLGKYDPPIELTTVRASFANYKFDQGESMDNNIWYQAYEKELGIKLKNLWVVPQEQYAEKFNVAIASNDLPDLFDVNKEQLKTLSDNGLLADMTGFIEKYGSPQTQQFLKGDGGIGIATSTAKGKLIAIPQPGSVSDKVGLLYVRYDWLKKLNLPEPKTLDDVVKIAEAFVNQDPDGDGKNDTYGLAMYKDSPAFGSSIGNINGFSNGYHAYPNSWIKDSSGKLVYGTIQPQMKTALAKLADMYKAGLIDKEFAVKDGPKINEDVAQGKIGLGYGVMWQPITPLQLAKDADPEADWRAYPLPSADGEPALPGVSSGVTVWHVANVNCKHPEAVIKMGNLIVAKTYGSPTTFSEYGNTAEGKEVFKMAINNIGSPTQNLDWHLAITDALNTKDTSKLSPPAKATYDKVVAYQNGDNKLWNQAMVFGPSPYSSQSVINTFAKNKNWVLNEYYGPSTPTILEKNAALLKMQTDMVTRIILGEASIDSFDKFVSDWKSLGGDAITKEVNDWYSSK